MRLLLFSFLSFFVFTASSQKLPVSKKLDQEIRLVVDNDAFTLNLYRDQYYSSGIYPSFRFLKDSTKKYRVVRTYQLNHRIYTPKNITWRDEKELDRPYAGQISVSAANDYFFHSGKFLHIELEMGWMGPSTKTAEIQEQWHGYLNMSVPRGWQYQINDTPLLSAYLTYAHPVFFSPKLELSTESNVAVGTVFDWIRQEIVIRTGRIRPLHTSAMYGASPGAIKTYKPVPKLDEVYFFYSPGIEYVLYNATIEGNFIGERSFYTETANRWVWQHRAGVMFSWPSYDLGFTYYTRSRETTEATNHFYVGIRMNQRF